MNYFSCANISLPLPFVTAVSWSKTAKTVEHTGGYLSSRGFEASEVSVRISVNPMICIAFGLKIKEWYQYIENIVTDRLSPSGVLRIAGYAVYPELEFALTNINKTVQYDSAGEAGIIEADLVFSGVRASKEVFRERALQMDTTVAIPKVKIVVGSKELAIQDGFQLTEFVTTPDSVHLAIECGSDMDLVSREGFLTDILYGGKVVSELPTGTTAFYVVSAYLVDSELVIEGSIYPTQSQQIVTKTYLDCDIKDIITDLCSLAGIECDCKINGEVQYYRAFGTPVDCLRALQTSAGFIMSYRQGKVTIADVPKEIFSQYHLEYLEMQDDRDSEPISGCYWYDGINKSITGTLGTNSIRISSVFRSTQDFSGKCLALARYLKNQIVVTLNINEQVDSHSVVSLQSNDSIITGMVEHYENDWINNLMTLEIHTI